MSTAKHPPAHAIPARTPSRPIMAGFMRNLAVWAAGCRVTPYFIVCPIRPT